MEKGLVTKQFKRREVGEDVYLEYKRNYMVAKSQAGALIAKAIEKQEERDLQEAKDKDKGEGRDWYRFIRGDTQGSINYPKVIKVEGEKITDRIEIRNEIEKFWSRIGGKDQGKMKYTGNIELIAIRREIYLETGPPSMNEIREVVKGLKDNKGVGMDGIPYEFYKFGGIWVIRALWELYKEVWESETIPGKWNESKVILL